MEERMPVGEDLSQQAFDPEMTEEDEANAPDATGRTVSEPFERSEDADDQQEVGI